jgi:hypothetical protein
MQPRQELLDIWRAVAAVSWRRDEEEWIWGGKYAANSIADAEQLLCLLMPASQVEVFGLDDPDTTSFDMLDALESLGGATEIPRRLINVLIKYYERYTDGGVPVFSGGSYFVAPDGAGDDGEPTEEQRTLDIVDSFAMSITLSLATIGFLRVFRKTTKRSDVQKQIKRLEEMASTRLTAAMVGLLRSFSVNVFDANDTFGRNLLRTVNQGELPSRQAIAELQQQLRQTAASFREVLIGSGQVSDLDSPDRLFECGWSWGIVREAPVIDTTPAIGEQRAGVAEQAPYLYFTVIAMDAIEDLFSERTRILGLLDEEQQRLSRALQLRSDLVRAYWAKVATFGDGPQWPLEDIPWRTTDGEESEYFTLQVTSLAVKGLTQARGSDAELVRVGAVLHELANRARITRRPTVDDPAMVLHAPGVQLTLNGSETMGKTRVAWVVNEFAPLLMHRMVGIAGLLSDAKQRGALLDMADRVWDHLVSRRLKDVKDTVGRDLWDQPVGAFDALESQRSDRPSWYYTERVVQALVVAANTLDRPPLRSDRMASIAAELLGEADHLFDNELMRGSADAGPVLERRIKEIRATLRRARELLPERPGTAAALSSNVLTLLDELSAGRQNANEVM